MPSSIEQRLMAMLQAERQRNAQSSRTAASVTVLPELRPEMLLSPSALREMEAVQGMRSAASYLPAVQHEPVAQARTTATLQPEPRGRTEFVAYLDESWDINLDEPEAVPSGDIESIFMASALRETGESSAYQPQASSFYDDFTFNSNDDVPIAGTTEPNPVARFQVGRESPPRMAFYRDRVSATDGAVVSSRGADGSWRSASAPRATSSPAPAARPSPIVRSPVASTPRPTSEPYRPSSWERLISGRGVLDD